MSNKRGQVTIFLIIGIVVLLAFAGTIYITSKLSEPISADFFDSDFSKLTKPMVLSFIEGCVKDQLLFGIDVAGLHGGKIYFSEENSLVLEDAVLTYAYNNNEILFDIRQTEKELAQHVDETLGNCINNFSVFDGKGLEIKELGIDQVEDEIVDNNLVDLGDFSSTSSQSEVRVNDGYVNIKIKYPVKVSKKEDSYFIDLLDFNVQSNLDRSFNDAEIIILDNSHLKHNNSVETVF